MYLCAQCGQAYANGGSCPNDGQPLVWVHRDVDLDLIDGEDQPYAWETPEDEEDDADDSE